MQAMRRKLKRAGGRSRYRLRMQIVEPVFGRIKQARGFRQLLLRGVDAVAAEWADLLSPQPHQARKSRVMTIKSEKRAGQIAIWTGS